MKQIRLIDRLGIDLSTQKVRSFGLILVLILLIVFGYRLIRYDEFLLIFLIIGIGIAAAAIGIPRALNIIYIPWMVIALTIGAVISYFLLFLVFFLILTPVGWSMRMFGRDPLRLKEKADSYWIERKTEQTDFERMF